MPFPGLCSSCRGISVVGIFLSCSAAANALQGLGSHPRSPKPGLGLHGDPEERKLGAVKKQTGKQAEVRALADLMGVPLRRLSKAAGGVATIARTLELLRGFYPNPEHLRIWLRTPHPDRSVGYFTTKNSRISTPYSDQP
jgi:hypothetical protein